MLLLLLVGSGAARAGRAMLAAARRMCLICISCCGLRSNVIEKAKVFFWWACMKEGGERRSRQFGSKVGILGLKGKEN